MKPPSDEEAQRVAPGASPQAPAASPAEAILARLASGGIRLGLTRPRRLLAALGHPERRLPAVLVAGTNGKGSTAALLASMATAGGYRTGLYTSPHLETVEEVVRVDGEPVEPQRLAALLERAVAAAEETLGEPPTGFEALTAAAFLHLAECRVELAVVEAGMGGRRDATNVCRPVASLLTNVSLEHRSYLGRTLAEIAREKAGIFRAGRPALTAELDPRVAAMLEAAARRQGTELERVSETVRIARREPAATGQRVELETPRHRHRIDLPLAGAHQVGNLALAVRAAEVLAGEGWERLTPAAIARGAAGCRLPGRLERLALSGGRELLLDAAHNPAAVAALVRHLDAAGEPFELLFGVFADKEAEAMLPPLAARASRVVLTRAPGPRGRAPQELEPLVPPAIAVEIEEEPEAALERALGRPGDLLVVCGSLALVGRLRRRLRRLGTGELR